jgi:DNA-directed RNA polymerase subunit RPC12/RpoP
MKKDCQIETRIIFEETYVALNDNTDDGGIVISVVRIDGSSAFSLYITYDQAETLAKEILSFCGKHRPSDNKCSCDDEEVKCPYCGSTDIYKGKQYRLCWDCNKAWEK